MPYIRIGIVCLWFLAFGLSSNVVSAAAIGFDCVASANKDHPMEWRDNRKREDALLRLTQSRLGQVCSTSFGTCILRSPRPIGSFCVCNSAVGPTGGRVIR